MVKKVAKKAASKKAVKAEPQSFVWQHDIRLDTSKPYTVYGYSFAFQGEPVTVSEEAAVLFRRRPEFKAV